MRVMFLGTGSAASGTAELMVMAYCNAGLSVAQARERIWFVDRKGLVVSTNEVIKPRIQSFAHVHPPCGFVEAIEAVKPDVLIGATGVANTFTEAVIRKMAEVNERPVIIALSNPTSHTECTAEEAYLWSDGRAIYASGSPFKPVRYKTHYFQPAQGNNAYIFPGVGLGVYASSARLITQSMFLSAAKVLSELVTDAEISRGPFIHPCNVSERSQKLLRYPSVKLPCGKIWLKKSCLINWKITFNR